jgi:hypothetical protein
MQLAADVGHPHAAAFLHQLGILQFLFFTISRISIILSDNPVPLTSVEVLLEDSQAHQTKQFAQEGPLEKLFACCRMRV